jgi:hypothetical protein
VLRTLRENCEFAGPLRHVAGFPDLGLLRVLRPISTVSTGNGPSQRPTGCWSQRGPPRWFPRSLLNRSTGSVPNYAPAASPRLRRRPSSWPPDRRHQPVVEFSVPRHRCAQQPNPYPSGLSWWISLERLLNAGSLSLHLSVLLAGPEPSNGAGPSRLLKRLLAALPRVPGVRLSLVHQPAATDWRRESCTPSRFKSASWRSISVSQISFGRNVTNVHLADRCWSLRWGRMHSLARIGNTLFLEAFHQFDVDLVSPANPYTISKAAAMRNCP